MGLGSVPCNAQTDSALSVEKKPTNSSIPSLASTQRPALLQEPPSQTVPTPPPTHTHTNPTEEVTGCKTGAGGAKTLPGVLMRLNWLVASSSPPSPLIM